MLSDPLGGILQAPGDRTFNQFPSMFLLQRRRPQGWAGDRLARVAHLQDDRDVKAIIPIAVTADVCDRTLTDHLRELLFAGWLGQETDATFHPPRCLFF